MKPVQPEDVGAESITIARCRELLGEDAEGLSDQDIDAIRQHAHTMAHVVIEMFLESRTPERP